MLLHVFLHAYIPICLHVYTLHHMFLLIFRALIVFDVAKGGEIIVLVQQVVLVVLVLYLWVLVCMFLYDV